MEPLGAEIEETGRQVVDAAYRVHRALGPGLLESVYERCLCIELYNRGIPFRRQIAFPIRYEGVEIDAGLRVDLLVADSVIVELKSAERLLPVFTAQVLTYLKLAGLELGFLINFDVPVIRDGIRRVVRRNPLAVNPQSVAVPLNPL